MEDFNNFTLIGKLQDDMKLYHTIRNNKPFGSWLLSVYKGKGEYELFSGIMYLSSPEIIEKYKKGAYVLVRGSLDTIKEEFIDNTPKYSVVLKALRMSKLLNFTTK